MGNRYSLPPDVVTHFDADEISLLSKKFRKIDTNRSGTLSIDEIMSLPELRDNPVVKRVIDVFDTDGNHELDFAEFLKGISQFSTKGDKESKLRFLFQLYDINGDGFISNGELFTVLKMLVGNNVTGVQLQQIVDKTIRQYDRDLDGKISYAEFCYAVANLHLDKCLITIPDEPASTGTQD